MSVIFTTITDSFIAMCADKQVNNMKTGEVYIDAATKIEKWTHNIGIGQCGSQELSGIILDAVRGVIDETGIDNYTLEEIGNLVCQAYYAAEEEYNVPKAVVAKIVVVGRLSNGRPGACSILATNGEADIEIVDGQGGAVTLIFEPDDMTSEECNALFTKAVKLTKNKKDKRDPIETIHRKAVRYVSEQSKLVSHKSDYLFFTFDTTK